MSWMFRSRDRFCWAVSVYLLQMPVLGAEGSETDSGTSLPRPLSELDTCVPQSCGMMTQALTSGFWIIQSLTMETTGADCGREHHDLHCIIRCPDFKRLRMTMSSDCECDCGITALPMSVLQTQSSLGAQVLSGNHYEHHKQSEGWRSRQ